jgi:hypothetical protein
LAHTVVEVVVVFTQALEVMAAIRDLVVVVEVVMVALRMVGRVMVRMVPQIYMSWPRIVHMQVAQGGKVEEVQGAEEALPLPKHAVRVPQVTRMGIFSKLRLEQRLRVVTVAVLEDRAMVQAILPRAAMEVTVVVQQGWS